MNLRSILSRYRIEWKDRGANCSKGWVNVRCPFCGIADPSFHCRISEELTGWYCLRNSRHRGSGVGWLFRKLGIPHELIPERSQGSTLSQQREEKPQLDYSAWGNFLSADSYPPAMQYLFGRKFSLPFEVSKQFNLKCASHGKWAGRLLIPLTYGWTGRALYGHIQPRYLSHTDERGFFLYGKGETAILVEGPLDAMKLAAVLPHAFTYIAMTSGYVSPAILYLLREREIHTIYSLPDDNVELGQRIEMLQTLRNALPSARVVNTRLPDWAQNLGYKDSGEMSEDEARTFLYSLS